VVRQGSKRHADQEYPLRLIVGQNVASAAHHDLGKVASVFEVASNLLGPYLLIGHARSSVESDTAVKVELAHEALSEGRADNDVEISRVDHHLVVCDECEQLRDHGPVSCVTDCL
jgi:hypothetical protein